MILAISLPPSVPPLLLVIIQTRGGVSCSDSFKLCASCRWPRFTETWVLLACGRLTGSVKPFSGMTAKSICSTMSQVLVFAVLLVSGLIPPSGHLVAATSHGLPLVRDRAAAAVLVLATRTRHAAKGLELLAHLAASSYVEVRLFALRGLERYLRNSGTALSGDGWSAVLSALGAVASCGKREEVARAFQLVQLVIHDLLPSLPPPLLPLLCSQVLVPFAAQVSGLLSFLFGA